MIPSRPRGFISALSIASSEASGLSRRASQSSRQPVFVSAERKYTEPVALSSTASTSFPPGLAASAYNPQRRLRPNRAPCSVHRQPTRLATVRQEVGQGEVRKEREVPTGLPDGTGDYESPAHLAPARSSGLTCQSGTSWAEGAARTGCRSFTLLQVVVQRLAVD